MRHGIDERHRTRTEQVWAWLGEVDRPGDPGDLGGRPGHRARCAPASGDASCVVTITPDLFRLPGHAKSSRESIARRAEAHGLDSVRLVNRLSPAWTTDWMSEAGKAAT